MPSQSRFARQLPRKRGSQNVTFRLGLPRVRGRWPAGPERATNNAGPAFRPTPQRDPIFRDAKVLLFWCDQQQKELLVRYFLFAVTSDGYLPEPANGL